MVKYIIIASIFWFNPLISNVDILPDLIGYLLILKAFSKASYVYTAADELCASAKKMCIITGVKLFSITLVSSLDSTMFLLMSFCFAIVESIFGIPFFIKLFKTFSKIVNEGGQNYGENKAQKLQRFTIVSFVVRLVLAMLPDLTALSLDNALNMNSEYSYIRFRPLLHMFSATISIVISIVWLVMFIKHVTKWITREVSKKCEIVYGDTMNSKKSVFVAKDNIKSTVFIAIGAIFIFDFNWGFTYADILQDFMLTFFVILSFVYLLIKGLYRVNSLFFILLGVFALQITVDILEINANVTYFEKYNLASILKVSDAEDLYINVCVYAVLTSL